MINLVSGPLANSERLTLLQRAGLFDASAEESFDRLARLAQRLTQAPIVLLSFFSESQQYLKSCPGAPEPWATERAIPFLESFCLSVFQSGKALVSDDARPLVEKRNNEIQHDFNIGAYLGVPLVSPDGYPLGVLCAIDHAPRAWLPEHREALEDLAATVLSLVSLRAQSGSAEALQASQERLELIAAATRDVVYDITLATGEIWWSRALVTLLGYPANEVEANLTWWQARIHPSDRPSVLESFERALQSSDPFWSKEYRFRRRDGTYIRLFDRGYLIRSGPGQASHFVGSVSDISNYRQVERAWQESDALLKQLYESTDQGVWLIDLDYRTTFVNRRMAEMLGYRREEILGTSVYDFMDETGQAILRDYLARREANYAQHHDFKFRRKDGSALWAMLSLGPLRTAEGTVTGGYALVSDTTERKHALDALQTAYTEIDDLYHNAPCGYHSLGPDGTFLKINNTELAWLGYTREELIGRKRIRDVITPDSLKTFEAVFPKFKEQGWINDLELELIRKNGEHLPVLLSSTAVKDVQGNFITTRTVLFDLSERKRAEQLVRQGEERFRQLAENIEQVFWITTPDQSEILYISPAYQTVWGRTCESLYADPQSFQESIHPEDQAYVRSRQSERSQGTYDVEYRIIRPDGAVRWIWSRAFPVRDAEGKVYRAAGISEDITERRQTEEALAHERDLLQALLDSIPDTIYFKDTESRFTRINKAQADFLGIKNAEDALGKSDIDFIQTPHLAKTLLDEEQRMMQGGQPVLEREERHIGPDGKVRWMLSTKVPIRERQGRVVGMVGVSRDITETKLAQAEMQAQTALFENLVAVARATAAMPSLEATLQNALRVSAQLTGAVRGSLFLLNENGQVTHSIRSEGEEMEHPRFELVGQVMQHGLAGWVTHHSVSALISDTDSDERWLPSPDQHYQARSVLAVPIRHSSIMLGIITLLHTEPDQFTADHLKLMEAAADQMALVLRNARMLDETQRLAEQMYMLNHITQAALAATTLDELYQALADRMGELFGSDACHITYWNDIRQQPVSKASSDPAWRTGGQALLSRQSAETLTRTVLAQGKAQAIADTTDTEALGGQVIEPVVKSLLALPLIAHARKLGSVILAFETPHVFSESEISLGERVARQVALALSNALLYREAAEERERLQALIDSSRDGVVLLSGDRHILICNEPTLRMLDLPGQPADWVGRPLRVALMTLARYAPDVMRAGLNEIRRVEHGDEEAREGEYKLDTQFVHWLNLPVKGEALGRLLVFRDVTEEHALGKMRDDLAHMMVHDLRSPLSAIIGATDLLAKKMSAISDEDQELAVIVRDSAERMLGLVNDILNVSQLEAGQMPVDYSVVAMGPLIAEVLQLQGAAMERKHLRVEGPSRTGDLPPVWGDLRLLVRVLQNLIGNAVKFTPMDGSLQVQAQVDGRHLQISISNSGPGIPAEIKSRLFTKFVRGNQREHGSGLGLAFCHLVVESHGGRIWAESEPGQGATFLFTVPLYQPGN